MRLIPSIGVMLFIVTTGIGQDYFEIKGKVLDGRSRQVLPYANIIIKGSSIGTISNEAGEYKFIVPSLSRNDTLIVSYIGYKTFKIMISTLKASGEMVESIKKLFHPFGVLRYVSLDDSIIMSSLRDCQAGSWTQRSKKDHSTKMK